MSDLPARLIGAFSLRLLAVIESLGEKATAPNIRHELSRRLGREVSVGQLYLTLKRLSNHGVIDFTKTKAVSVRGGRSKKIFGLKQVGRDYLKTLDVE